MTSEDVEVVVTSPALEKVDEEMDTTMTSMVSKKSTKADGMDSSKSSLTSKNSKLNETQTQSLSNTFDYFFGLGAVQPLPSENGDR